MGSRVPRHAVIQIGNVPVRIFPDLLMDAFVNSLRIDDQDLILSSYFFQRLQYETLSFVIFWIFAQKNLAERVFYTLSGIFVGKGSDVDVACFNAFITQFFHYVFIIIPEIEAD
jgi:hypothetical protein